MDPMLDAAQKKRAELLKELEKIDHFLETYRSLAIELKLESANESGTQAATDAAENPVDRERMEVGEADVAPAAPTKRARVTDNPKPRDVVAAAVNVIRERGRPMSRRDIHRALAERGMVVRGADPIKALGTMLWRSGADALEQVEGAGYWPKGEPLPDELRQAYLLAALAPS